MAFLTCVLRSVVLALLLVKVSGKELAPEHRERVKRSDDVSIASLQALVEQQASVIQTLQSKLTAAENRISTLESHESQLPSFKQVAFYVRFRADNNGNGIALGSKTILRFDNVITNIGNGYDPQTGIFTAPVAGTYVFFVSMMSVNNHGQLYLVIDKHGTALGYAFADGSDVYDQGAAEVTTHMAAGEQLWVRQDSGDAVRGAVFTGFSGYLVQAD